MSAIHIVPAQINDAEVIHNLIMKLAIYEKAPNEVLTNVDAIKQTLFNKDARAHCILAKKNAQCLGFAVYFINYSTWLGQYGIYLEDLYVLAEHRGLGVAKKMMHYLANIAVKENYGRIEWNVLDWNKPAIDFYCAIGAKAKDEWITYRFEKEDLQNFAKRKIP